MAVHAQAILITLLFMVDYWPNQTSWNGGGSCQMVYYCCNDCKSHDEHSYDCNYVDTPLSFQNRSRTSNAWVASAKHPLLPFCCHCSSSRYAAYDSSVAKSCNSCENDDCMCKWRVLRRLCCNVFTNNGTWRSTNPNIMLVRRSLGVS